MEREKLAQLQEHMRAMQQKLREAADTTSIMLLELDMANDYREWRHELSERTLNFIVDLDLALADLHQERQRLLESQLDNLARSN